MKLFYATACLALLLFTNCQPDLDNAPAFILIEDIRIETPGLGGSTSAVTEVWAFADEIFIGAFPLPARIPVHEVGPTKLRFQAGVRRNGVSATPDIYEFYAGIERNLELVPEQTTDLGVLTTGYRSDVRFGFVENFELDRARVFVEQVQGMPRLETSGENVRSGNFSGKLTLDEDNFLVEIASNAGLRDLFANRPVVWLEVDFRSDSPVAWGVVGERNGARFQRFDPTSAPRDEWTKIYFDMSELVAVANLNELEIYLSTILADGESEAEIFLDNIRLLYF